MSAPHRPIGPTWNQPIGLWRQRGASTTALRLGMGLSVVADELESAAAFRDTHGYSAWHYWAESPSPHLRWKALHHSGLRTACSALAQNGEHPWHRLAIRGQAEALAQWRADEGPPDRLLPLDNGDGVLHLAAWSGNEDTLGLILETGVGQLGAQDALGLTPLMIAIHRLPEAAARRLIAAGADPNQADAFGRTALHHAALYSNHGLLICLEEAGGDGDVADSHQTTPGDLLLARREQSDRDRASLRAHWHRRYLGKSWF